MMIVMKEGASPDQVDAVVARVESVGAQAHISQGELVTVIGAIGDREHVANLGLEGFPGVDHLVPILKPYKLASAQVKRGERTVVEVDGRKLGGPWFATIAGPCTVESREVMLDTARTVRDAGAQMLRGGAYKPRTSPYSFQGLGDAGLPLLAEAKEETGLPVVRELSHLPVVIDPSHAAGRRDWVLPLSLAAAAAGADGIIVEIHPEPETAICDGPQAVRNEDFADYLRQVEAAAAIARKELV